MPVARITYALHVGEDVSSKAGFPYSQFCPANRKIILPEYIFKVFNCAPDAWNELNEKRKSGDVTITDHGEGHGYTLMKLLNVAIKIPLLEAERIMPSHKQVKKAIEYASTSSPEERELFDMIINHAYANSTDLFKQAFAHQIKPGLQVEPLAQKVSTFMKLSKKLDELASSFMRKPEN